MIYTTYFAKVKSLPTGVIPVSICMRPPNGWRGEQMKSLAPDWGLINMWKDHLLSEAEFREQYYKEVLAKKDPDAVVAAIHKKTGGRDFALVCYEKTGDVCHRHYIADWLSEAGYPVKEFV